MEEGVRGPKAVEWRLVDEVVPKIKWEAAVRARAREFAANSDRPATARGIVLGQLDRQLKAGAPIYDNVRVEIARENRSATLTVSAPAGPVPSSVEAAQDIGARFWPLALARELEDAILHLRFNEPGLGVLILRTEGDLEAVLDYDSFLVRHQHHWLMREIRHYLKRVLKRLDRPRAASWR